MKCLFAGGLLGWYALGKTSSRQNGHKWSKASGRSPNNCCHHARRVGDECIVYQMRITESKEEAYQLLERYIQCVWKDPSMLARLMEKQVKIQSKLLYLLTQQV